MGKRREKMRRKLRLVLMDDGSFREERAWRVSVGGITALAATAAAILIAAGALLMAYTPLRLLIPEYPDAQVRRGIVDNSLRADSLERLLQTQAGYIANLRAILTGDIDTDTAAYPDPRAADSLEDLLRGAALAAQPAALAAPAAPQLVAAGGAEPAVDLATARFFPPVRGVVSNVYNPIENHFGIDIVTQPRALICATLPGTVVHRGWTFESGNVVQIQHDNNLISVYKHNATVFKEQGDHVYIGEPIGTVGSTGEYSTGPHLHLEIWHRGEPVNPADYISF